VLTAFTYGIVTPCFAQNKPAPRLETFFRDDIGLSEEQVAAIISGTAIAQTLHSRQADEIFVFGAVYVNATPKAYLEFARDFDYLRKLPGYLAIDAFSNPPQLSDLKQFTFDQEEFKELKNCKAGNCEIQMPASSIDELHSTVDFSAPDAEERLSQILKVTLLERLAAYQKEGNEALGVYNDKRNPTEVPAGFLQLFTGISEGEPWDGGGHVLLEQGEIRIEADLAGRSRVNCPRKVCRRTGVHDCRETTLLQPLFSDSIGPDVLHFGEWRPKRERLLSGESDGFGTGRANRIQGIHRSQGRHGPLRFFSAKVTDSH
jgi:hypothetical protein